MEFYPEGCCEKLGKTFASIDEIKNAMIKNEIIEGKVLNGMSAQDIAAWVNTL